MQRAAVAALAALLAHASAAQQPPSQLPRESFRTGVELVEVDVIVTDKQGRPVRGLTRDDFEISEDGKPVGIESFQAIELPDALPMEAAAVPTAASGAAIHQNLRALERASTSSFSTSKRPLAVSTAHEKLRSRAAGPFTGPAGSVMDLPLPTLAPGTYRLHVRVRSRTTELHRKIAFTIRDRDGDGDRDRDQGSG